MADTITVQKRESRGTRNARRQRTAGNLPAILYGHGEESVSLSVPAQRLHWLVRHGVKLVDLDGDIKESALINTLQWDTFGNEIIHVDFTRVSADERIEVELTVEIRGVAPGVSQGGAVEQLVHRLTIACQANQIPENIDVSINELNLDEAITAAQLTLPEGALVLASGGQEPAEMVVVQCIVPQEAPEEELTGEGGGVEPELVGGKKEEDESEEKK